MKRNSIVRYLLLTGILYLVVTVIGCHAGAPQIIVNVASTSTGELTTGDIHEHPDSLYIVVAAALEKALDNKEMPNKSLRAVMFLSYANDWEEAEFKTMLGNCKHIPHGKIDQLNQILTSNFPHELIPRNRKLFNTYVYKIFLQLGKGRWNYQTS